MSKPKPYSSTDTGEQEAYTTLLGLLDPTFFKLDIRTRDKYPNADGTIELVTEAQVPYGKFEVQLRKIPAGAKRYSCPSSLVEYSRVSTLPVLICADSDKGIIHWRHITPTMPEFKEGQKYFTIRFDEPAGAIDSRISHHPGWTEIVKEYQQRVQEYMLLRKEVDLKLHMTGLTPDLKETFQRFVDTVNRLLDEEFVSFKNQLFPGVWKLGVAVSPHGPDGVLYQVLKIPYGSPAPLVRQSDGTILARGEESPSVFYEAHVQRERIQDPEAVGRAFILEYVKRGLVRQVLSIHGTLVAADVVTCFVDRYHALLGLPGARDSYHLPDLQHGLYHRLYNTCAALADGMTTGKGQIISLHLDSVLSVLRTRGIKPIGATGGVAFAISSRPPLRLFLDALQYLAANQASSVERIFAQRGDFGSGWVWSGYSLEDDIRSVSKILAASVDEYSSFVRGNRLRLPSSPFLDGNMAIVYEYQPSAYSQDPWPMPLVKSLYLQNHDHRLPKVSVRVRTGTEEVVDDSTFPQIVIDGEPFQATESVTAAADFLFHEMPVLNMVYRMLTDDLQRHYDLGMISVPHW